MAIRLLWGLAALLALYVPVSFAAQAFQAPVTRLDAEALLRQGRSGTQIRQTLTNYHDLQYVTYLNIGKQTLAGIIDTGSFELVVFTKECQSCGKAAKYNPNISSTYQMGTLTNRQTYGSGDTFSREAFDVVSIGAGSQVNQTFWEVTRAQMPLLVNAEFQAIIGVGPPETPAADAWASVSSVVQIVRRYLGRGALPPAATSKRANSSSEVAAQMSRSPPMLGTLGVGTFSVCLGAHPGSDGYFVWNDTMVAEQPSLFTRIPVIGRHTWTLNLTGVWLAEPLGMARATEDQLLLVEEPRPSRTSLGCAGGCGAVVDSGTSMLVVPSAAIEALSNAVQRMDEDCSNIHELPDLVFDFDGIKVSLPPDAYVAEVLGEVPSYLEGLARVRRLRRRGSRCELLVMESSSDTNYGPLWILGMPFFRSFYTSFQVGRSSKERAVHITPAGEDCAPGSEVPAFALTGTGGGCRCSLRRIDPSKMLVSHNAWRASTSSFVAL
eukprot:CAMPEP_0204599156 /NCGR_PEP_ID=MMETSP0661-20131031/54677_1 /ASSEMBLY_ACC=CAM_ASM_000606 /TAXON_ID=109239 /ORGANISM="Alexandrium margalefi, Strain AMGDE01CS-322" /LENGTH=493 /DNA_ID=CAMNT_0051609871 /DNA_START=66 /DNA_END=1547 /DNA_ORIENTATION=+